MRWPRLREFLTKSGAVDGVIDDIARPSTQPEIVGGFVMNRATRRQFKYEKPVNWRQR